MAKVALLVGVSEYEPGLNPLPGSVKDVDAIQRVLADPELGGFAETDITVLKNPQRQAMEDAIYWLFSDRKKDDLLLLYFSGHGIKDENGRLYLATRATRKDSSGRLVKPSAVATGYLHENINESRSQHQIIILDCCFSGAIAQGMAVKDDGTVNLKDYLGGKGRAILTSSSSTEYSFGSETAGHEDAGLSIYTRYLVEGIEKGAADTDGDGWIAVEELHEYAASRVKEAAPAMTPKFYPVEEGYKIVLARSRKDDPKVKYRKEAQARAEQGQGKFSIVAQRLLKGKQVELGIAPEEARAIEDDVLQPYREYEQKLQEYEQTLTEVVQEGYPFSAKAEAELKEYQQHLGLRDLDIAAAETRILAPLKAKYEQQQQQARRLKQEQEKAEYENKLQRYGQEYAKAIGAEYPLSQANLNRLRSLQQQQEVKDEDIARIEQPLREPVEAKYQEKLRQQREAEQQQREELEKRQKAEYEDKLRRYEQEFSNAIQAEYPLIQPVLDWLKTFQQQLMLTDEAVAQIEQPLRKLAEAKYQTKIQQAEAERQRFLLEEQRREEEKRKQVAQKSEAEQRQREELENRRKAEYEDKLRQQAESRKPNGLVNRLSGLLTAFNSNDDSTNKSQIDRSIQKTTNTIIGIDLGTTNAVISALQGGKPTIIPNAEGMHKTPLVVAHAKNGECLVGPIAKRQAVMNPDNTFYSITRLVGQRYNEVTDDLTRVSYKVSNANGSIKVDCPVNGKQYTPEQILAELLKKLKDDASKYLGETVTQTVITVPVYFNDSQRQAIKEAGKIAGLEVLRIINKASAASLAYGLGNKSGETALVFHLGGGTFGISIVEAWDLNNSVVEVLAYSGDLHLGGDDFDKKIVDFLAEEFRKVEKIDLRKDKQAMQRLIEAAEKAKIELSSATHTEINLPFITATQDGPKHIETTLTRAQFEKLCSDLINRCRVSVENAMRDARTGKEDIDRILLTGGSTHIPAVQELVQRLLGKTSKQTVNPDEVVAVGASLYVGIDYATCTDIHQDGGDEVTSWDDDVIDAEFSES
jgi:molecular chaperone DnaK (HSP70)